MKNLLTYKLLFACIVFLSAHAVYSQKSDYKKWEKNFYKGQDLFDSKKINDALPYFETAFQIAQNTFTQKEEELEITAYHLALVYNQIQKYEKAEPLYLISLECLEYNGKENNSDYGVILSELAVVYRNMGEYKKASDSLLKSLEIIKNSLGINNLTYAKTLLELSIVYKKKGEFTRAISTNLESIAIIKKLYGARSKLYAQYLTFLSQIYIEMGDYEKAFPIQKKAIASYTDDKNSMDYVLSIYTMALLYHEINEYQKGILLYEEVIEILGENDQGSISVFNNLGQAYDHLGDYEKALFYTNKSISKTSETDPELATRLQNIAFIYVELGNYDKALIYYNKALSARKNISGTDHYLYGRIVNNIGKLYEQKGDLNQAEKLYKEALDNLLKNFDENHFNYGYYLNDYASVLLKKGENEKAISLFEKNISILEKNSRVDIEDYYKSQYFLAKAYNKTGNYAKALPLLIHASEKIKKMLGSNHLLYGRILESLSDSYFGLGKIDEAVSTIELSNSIVIGQIDKIFKFRSEKEKKAFLHIMINNFDRMQSISYRNDEQYEKLNDINLDNQLMLKGLLLNNSKNVLTQLSTLNDTLIDNKIISYRSLKKEYARSMSLPIDERVTNINRLKEDINTKESELVRLYSVHFKDNIGLSKDWKSSQSKLSENEIAIEYSSFHLENENKQIDSVMYVAYVFKRDWQHPKMIPLFEEKELINFLKNKSPNELYNSEKLHELVWKPLTKYMDKGNTVYFSPSGLLNQISFAALKEESYLGNNYSLIRLGSTSIISENLTEPVALNTLFIGAINYDYTKTSNGETELSEYSYLDTENFLNSKATRSRGESWNALPGALKEIEGLQSILESKGYSYRVLTGNAANESQFKKLSGNSPSIIHIATHGFFYENLNLKHRGNQRLSTEDHYRLAEDPLLRSGLIFAGANFAWKNGVNPNEEEDGILTALEISNLDLSKTKMVVLSACETGLGDVDGSEGVYGLQRAFKMAGVDIIVMSLWQVPDAETAEFMTLFYTNWLGLKDVRKAFGETQSIMQQKYTNEPFKWAAFVLFE